MQTAIMLVAYMELVMQGKEFESFSSLPICLRKDSEVVKLGSYIDHLVAT